METQRNLPRRALWARRRLASYDTIFEVGRGGMASVYLAHQQLPQDVSRYVALKCVRAGTESKDKLAAMFLDEVRVSALITHPNACRVFDFGVEEDTPFMAMEFLVGEAAAAPQKVLRKHPGLAQRPFHIAVVCKIVAGWCEALHAAHNVQGQDASGMGIVHRDATPHNLFVLHDGSVRVVDFGIAKFHGRAKHTKPSAIRGKLIYLSPEQLTRDPIDHRTDVWALGVVLWELLTSRTLFGEGSEAQRARAVLMRDIPAPSSINPAIPAELDAIVARALERKVDRRCPSARELGEALLLASSRCCGHAMPSDVANWLAELVPDSQAGYQALFELANAVVMNDDLASPGAELTAPIPLTRLRKAAGED